MDQYAYSNMLKKQQMKNIICLNVRLEYTLNYRMIYSYLILLDTMLNQHVTKSQQIFEWLVEDWYVWCFVFLNDLDQIDIWAALSMTNESGIMHFFSI